MKRKSIIMSLSFSGYILLAILLQACHSWEHLYKSFQETHCSHHYAKGKSQISHAHTPLDHCFTCDFAFTGATETPVFTYSFYRFSPYYTLNASYKQSLNSLFNGCLFSDRAPPLFFS